MVMALQLLQHLKTDFKNTNNQEMLKKAEEMEKKILANLESGYKRLIGYETKTKGYEWFGDSPGHEALTAYGLN